MMGPNAVYGVGPGRQDSAAGFLRDPGTNFLARMTEMAQEGTSPRIYDDDVSTPVPMSPAKKRWEELKKVAPLLAKLERRHWNETPPPRVMNDPMFIALAACFCDPTKREILRTLILDLLADDLQGILLAFLTEEPE
jgi:hypothetical protein